MKIETKELFNSNSDILNLLNLVKSIGWNSIRHQSIQRIIYLSKVLFSFANLESKNLFQEYHFITTISGPYSEQISNSLTFLKSNEYITEEDGEIKITDSKSIDEFISEDKYQWLKTIVYILGLYGENKIFGFTINDPLYKDSLQRNEPKELDATPDNITIKSLNQFKKAFEESLEDVSKIDRNEYLELYFEFIFSKIVKREV